MILPGAGKGLVPQLRRQPEADQSRVCRFLSDKHPLLLPGNAPFRPNYPREGKVLSDLVVTILIPFCIVAIGLLAIAMMTTLQQWKKRKTIERGITDVVRQVRHTSGARSKPQDFRNHQRQKFPRSGRRRVVK